MSRYEFNKSKDDKLANLETDIDRMKARIMWLEEQLGIAEDELSEKEAEHRKLDELTYEDARALYLEDRT